MAQKRANEQREPLTEAEAWPRLLRYCAFQERSPAEVSQKMRGYGLEAEAQERLLERLREENYLSEARFTEAYAGGKLRANRWGERKIAMGLAAKGIDRETIAGQLESMPKEDFRHTLRTLLEKRDAQYKALPPAERRQKLYRLGVSRGFTNDLVAEEVNRLLKGLGEED